MKPGIRAGRGMLCILCCINNIYVLFNEYVQSKDKFCEEMIFQKRDSMSRDYVVLYVDIHHSKRVTDRSRFARGLRSALAKWNRNLNEHLLGRLSLRAGADEFVGIVRPQQRVLASLVTGLWWDLHPVAGRLVLLKGGLDVVPSPERNSRPPWASEFDGEAMWRADEAMQELKNRDGFLWLELSESVRRNRMAAALGESLYVHTLSWTARQLSVLRSYVQTGSQVRTAEYLGVHQTTVSRSLSSIRSKLFLHDLRVFQDEVEQLDQETPQMETTSCSSSRSGS